MLGRLRNRVKGGNRTKRTCGICYVELSPLASDLPPDAVLDWMRLPLDAPNYLGPGGNKGWTRGAPVDGLVSLTAEMMILKLRVPIGSILSSIERGCHGCAAIWNAAMKELEYQNATVDVNHQRNLILRWVFVSWTCLSARTLTLEIPLCGKSSPRACLGYSLWSEKTLGRQPAVEFVKEEYTGSASSLSRLAGWLSECCSSHPGCNRSGGKSGPLPDRILHISGSKYRGFSLRLSTCEESRTRQRYACLSHRWGPSTKKHRTLTSNIDEQKKSISFANLPQTFREAVEVTSFLGLEYLWIDSLCIIQDDADDWRAQAAKMCDVYQGSFVTILASNSTDSDDGLFRIAESGTIHVSDRNPMKLQHIPSHLTSQTDIQGAADALEFPLITRAWVYQERVLSPRLLHFNRAELAFSCGDWKSQCQCGTTGNYNIRNRYLGALDRPKQAYAEWCEIAREYSRLLLSFPTDRLAALAGVARQLGQTHVAVLGRYMAGLWERTMLRGLLWSSGAYGRRAPRSSSYCAPTWSWASVTGPVNAGNSAPRATDDLEVLAVETLLAGPDDFGPVTGGRLAVRAPLCQGELVWGRAPDDRDSFRGFGGHDLFFKADYNWRAEGTVHHIPDRSPIFLLKTGFIWVGQHICLVLRPLEGPDQYERIGYMDNAKTEEIEIVFGLTSGKSEIEIV